MAFLRGSKAGELEITTFLLLFFHFLTIDLLQTFVLYDFTPRHIFPKLRVHGDKVKFLILTSRKKIAVHRPTSSIPGFLLSKGNDTFVDFTLLRKGIYLIKVFRNVVLVELPCAVDAALDEAMGGVSVTHHIFEGGIVFHCDGLLQASDLGIECVVVGKTLSKLRKHIEVVELYHSEPELIPALGLYDTFVDGVQIAPVLDGLCGLSVDNKAEFPLQVKPFALDVECVQESELVVNHSFCVVGPHVIDSVLSEL